MTTLKHLFIVTGSSLLVACTPSPAALPASPQQAQALLSNFGNEVTAVQEDVQAKTQSVLGGVERVGDGVSGSARYVGSKLEGLGNLVIEATGTGPQTHSQ